jgi:hypothetical protein
LPDQVIQPLFDHHAVSLHVHVDPVRRAPRSSIEQHAKSYQDVARCLPHDERKIADVKAVGDPSR